MISSDVYHTQMGKLITIYPNNFTQFKLLCELLYQKLCEFEGPRIVSDNRYKNSIVHYRYGNISDDSDVVIVNGQEYLDNRNYFWLPENITDPFILENKPYEIDAKYIGKIIDPISIIKFSSGGNVYEAKYGSQKCILKEAKPFVLSGNSTSIEELLNEIELTSNLNYLLNEFTKSLVIEKWSDKTGFFSGLIGTSVIIIISGLLENNNDYLYQGLHILRNSTIQLTDFELSSKEKRFIIQLLGHTLARWLSL